MAGAWGEPPWQSAPPAPRAPLPRRCDAAVVGAGLAGLAAARSLAARGLAVEVLEAARVGAGASGRTGGIALEGTHVGELSGADRCLDTLRDLVGALGIECGLRLDGCRELVHVEPGRAGAGPGWRDAGRELAVACVVPGGVVDPGRLLAGIARAATAAGATLHEGTRVSRIQPRDGRLRLETPRGALEADAAVLALNAFTASLLPLDPAPLSALTLALCTEPLPRDAHEALGLAAATPFYTVDLPYLWGRTTGDGRLVLGSGLVVAEPEALGRSDVSRGEAAERLDALELRVRALHPALADVKIATRWGGPVCILRGRPPFCGRHPALPAAIVVGGFTGHGVAASLHFGEWAARAVAEGAPLPEWGAL